MKRAIDVDEYIALAPKQVQNKLKELRLIIRKTAAQSEERISYGMPFYDYHGRLIYFAVSKHHIGIYIPPPIIEEYKSELSEYTVTKSAIHLPFDQKLPAVLIEKLIKARMKINETLMEKADH